MNLSVPTILPLSLSLGWTELRIDAHEIRDKDIKTTIRLLSKIFDTFPLIIITKQCRKAPVFRRGDIRHIFYIAFYGIILAYNRNND
jgi:hypothetical protein